MTDRNPQPTRTPTTPTRVYYCGFSDDPDAGGFADDATRPGVFKEDERVDTRNPQPTRTTE